MILTEKFSDAEVVRKVLEGEKSLYEIIVRRFNPYLYKVGRSYNYNHDDTLDLMQDTYIDAYKNLSQFEGRSHFRTWIIRIMLNNCYRKGHKSNFKNEILLEVNDNSKLMTSKAGNNTDEEIQNRELGHIIEDALSKIPLEYRMVFSLREINGLSVTDTATLMDISDANVKVRLNRAKAMLRNVIEKKYSASELFEFNLIYCDAIVENIMKKIYEL